MLHECELAYAMRVPQTSGGSSASGALVDHANLRGHWLSRS